MFPSHKAQSLYALPKQPHQFCAVAKSSTASARWAACVRRDPLASSAFVYAVISTRIYCRPNCGSRLARRDNVVFFELARDAESAGFRPCKRCKPEQSLASTTSPLKDKMNKALARVQESADRGEHLRLSDLASEFGVSKWHLLRVFKKDLGATPNEISRSIRRIRESGHESRPTALNDSLQSRCISSVYSTPNTTTPSECSDSLPLDWQASTIDNYVGTPISSSYLSHAINPVALTPMSCMTQSPPTIRQECDSAMPKYRFTSAFMSVPQPDTANAPEVTPNNYNLPRTMISLSASNANVLPEWNDSTWDDGSWTDLDDFCATYADGDLDNMLRDLFPELCISV